MRLKTAITAVIGGLMVHGVSARTVIFQADFDAAAPVSGSVTANAVATNLNAGTSIGSWTLPDVAPGAIISDGGSNKAFVFDRATSGSNSNTVLAALTQTVDLSAGEALNVEMDLYAVRQANGQRVEFSLEDPAGNPAYTFVFRMNNTKDFFTFNASDVATGISANATGVNNGFKNPAVDGYLSWGATMIHVKVDVSSQPSQAGNYGAKISLDWNGDGDYADSGELLELDFGARASGVTEISTLRIANDVSKSGGAWIDNLTVTAQPGTVTADRTLFNLAKYQTATADSGTSSNPDQFATDGFVSQDSRWVSSGAGPHTLEIELAVPMTIGSAHLFSGGTWDSPMADLTLQYYNGGGW
uniref:hypothetical protein n=1 Tax=Pontiella sp. TaxID=2837462 RepID=UPI0035633341